jgi:hypothetical protein
MQECKPELFKVYCRSHDRFCNGCQLGDGGRRGVLKWNERGRGGHGARVGALLSAELHHHDRAPQHVANPYLTVWILFSFHITFPPFDILPPLLSNLRLPSSHVSCIFLHTNQLLLQNRMALLQLLAIVVTRALNELMVLQHLLGHELRKIALVSLLVDLVELCLLASRSSQLVKDLRRRVVSLCAEDTSSKEGVAVLDDGLDELAYE